MKIEDYFTYAFCREKHDFSYCCLTIACWLNVSVCRIERDYYMTKLKYVYIYIILPVRFYLVCTSMIRLVLPLLYFDRIKCISMYFLFNMHIKVARMERNVLKYIL